LMTYEDISQHLSTAPEDRLYLLPEVCLNGGRFLDGHTIEELQQIRHVKVIPATGAALRAQLEMFVRSVSGDAVIESTS
jgi:hypothetical protein